MRNWAPLKENISAFWRRQPFFFHPHVLDLLLDLSMRPTGPTVRMTATRMAPLPSLGGPPAATRTPGTGRTNPQNTPQTRPQTHRQRRQKTDKTAQRTTSTQNRSGRQHNGPATPETGHRTQKRSRDRDEPKQRQRQDREERDTATGNKNRIDLEQPTIAPESRVPSQEAEVPIQVQTPLHLTIL